MEDNTKLVAVYGSLRKGLGNHRVLGESKLIGTTKTEPKFTMFSYGAFPGLLKDGDTEITIEVYKPENNDTWERLDVLEGYPDFYDRMIIETEFGNAWMYYNKNAGRYNNGTVDSGDWKEFILKNVNND